MAGRQRRFLDRVEAGGLLAEVVTGLVRPPVLVLGVPRGGVVVAAQGAARQGRPIHPRPPNLHIAGACVPPND